MENGLPPPPSQSTPPSLPPQPAVAPPVVTHQGLRQPSRRGGGKVWLVVGVVLAVLVVVGMVGLFGRFLQGLSGLGGRPIHAGPHLQEVVIESNGSANKIAVVPIEGILLSEGLGAGHYNLVRLVEDQLKLAGKDDDVKAVILKIDSPGGEVLAADDIASAISKFQKQYPKPVLAAMSSLAASGGYYVAAPCRWIVANELTITGSIGVIMHGYNYRGLMNKVGVRPQVFKSGRFKDMLSGDRDLDNLTAEEKEIQSEEQKMVQALIEQTYQRFLSVVGAGREQSNAANKNNPGDKADQGQPLNPRWKDYADGRILSGKDAYTHGFVDEVGNWEVAVRRARKLAEIKNADLVTYQQPFDLGNLFRLLGKSDAGSIKLDLGFDAPRLKTGRLYFLSPLFVP